MDINNNFLNLDYVMIGLSLLIPLSVGLYFDIFKNQNTLNTYFLGNRKLDCIPVAISMIFTPYTVMLMYIVPSDIYTTDSMIWLTFVGMGFSTFVAQCVLLVPLFQPLELLTVYEYLGRRYNSRAVQLLGTYLGLLQTLLYMSVVLLAPALALESVAGVPLWMSIVVVGIIGTIYTSLGGIKSVVWTDVFQFIMLYAGLTIVLVLGGIKVGGMGRLLSVANAGGRINFSNASFDPRVRHTIWSCVIGGMFNWLPNCCNQSAVQRICAMKSTRDAKIACLLNIPLGIIYGAILTLTGLLLYSYFQITECDPIQAGFISNPNQVMPYFVMHVLSNLPGLAGIFIAALFSGALSSLSSGINAMSANIVEDVLMNYLKNTSQIKQTLIAKLVVLVCGVLTVILAYLAKNLTGPVTQIALSAMGATGGPVAGIIFLGAIFPQANWIGAFFGGVVALVINIWIAVGSVLYGNKAPKSSPVSTAACFPNSTQVILNSTSAYTYESSTFTHVYSSTSAGPVVQASQDHLVIYDLSYLYLGLIGFSIAIIVGFLVSAITGFSRDHPTESKYIFPCLRGFWKSGYTAARTDEKYMARVTKKEDLPLEEDHVVPKIAPIKALDMNWYNKLPEDTL